MLAVLRAPKPRWAGRSPRTRRGSRRPGCARAGTSSKLWRHVEHMATVTYATGRLPQGFARSAEAFSKRVGLLIPGSAGDAAPAPRRVAGYLYAINATSARWHGDAPTVVVRTLAMSETLGPGAPPAGRLPKPCGPLRGVIVFSGEGNMGKSQLKQRCASKLRAVSNKRV